MHRLIIFSLVGLSLFGCMVGPNYQRPAVEIPRNWQFEDALVDQKRSREQPEAQGRQVEALWQYARIARLRFDKGYVSYIEVLDAERSLFNAEPSYVQTQGAIFRALVNVL